jgi:hypothetical protein
MPRPKILHGPIDSILGKLHEAIAAPHRIPQISVGLFQLFHQVSNIQHRQFLESKFDHIQLMRNSPDSLAKISNDIDAWNDREFPVHGSFK